MKKNISIVLSATMFLSGLGYSSVFADDVTLEIEPELNPSAIKLVESTGAVNKDQEPDYTKPIAIEKFNDIEAKLKQDFKKDVSIQNIISGTDTVTSGRLNKAVDLAVYRITDKEYAESKAVLTSDKLVTDSRFKISNEDGSYTIPLKDVDLKPGDHLVTCISYRFKYDNTGKIETKTYLVNTEFVSVNSIKAKVGEKVKPKDAIVGLPKDANIENISIADTSTEGNKEAKIRVTYQGLSRDFVIPVIVSDSTSAVVDPNSKRISGTNRYETNLESIKNSFKMGLTKTVIIASGENFADPLSAGPLAMKKNAPIVFSTKTGLKPEAVKLIKDLGAKEAIIVGGTNSVPELVKNQLARLNVRRIAGANRYLTSKMLLNEFGPSKHIIFADGRDFADALSATPLAKKLKAPILLVDKEDKVPKVLAYHDAYIVGGAHSVSPAIEANIKSKMPGKNLYRTFGKNREQTSAIVAEIVKYDVNILANGRVFADALSSVNLLNDGGKTLLLVDKNAMSHQVKNTINGKLNYIIGGTNAITKDLLGY